MQSHLAPVTETAGKSATQHLQCPHGPAGRGLELALVDAFRAVVMSPGHPEEDRDRTRAQPQRENCQQISLFPCPLGCNLC